MVVHRDWEPLAKGYRGLIRQEEYIFVIYFIAMTQSLYAHMNKGN
jgi:hypothetical protein